jgi:tetratricopeptide (TPR) repeat protein
MHSMIAVLRFPANRTKGYQAKAAALILAVLVLAGCSSTDSPPLTSTPPSLQETAQVLVESGKLEQAAELWQDILEEDPANAEAHYRLGLLWSIINPEQAAEQLEQAASLDSTLADQGRRIRDTLRQVSFIEDPAYQLTVVGQALSSLEEWPLAQTALERAVKIDPAYAEAWAYLGEVRQQNGRDDGLEALQTAIKLNPESYAANLLMSIYWKRNHQPNRALPFLQTAKILDPSNPTLMEDLADTLVQAGMVEPGFDTIEALVTQEPDQPENWLMLARLSIENGLQVEQVGLPAARQAVLLDPENAAATTLLGRAYLLTEDPILAERFFLKAIQQDPQMAAPHLYLAIIYLNQENPQPAKPHLQDALSLAEAAGNQAIAEQAKDFLQRYFP